MTTPIAPGPDISGMASGASEMSSLSAASWLSSGVMRACEVTMPHAVFATISPPAILITGSEMPKKMQHEASKEKKRHQDDEHPNPGLVSRATPLLRGPTRRHSEENRNPPKRIDDREQRQKRRCRRVRKRTQKLSQRVSGTHNVTCILRASSPRAPAQR